MTVTQDKKGHDKSDVHRGLHLTTPLMHGPDVRELQQACNRFAENNPQITHFKLQEDGELGEHTFSAVHRVAYLEGLTEHRLNVISNKDVIVQPVQQAIRAPDGRTQGQKARGEKRQEEARQHADHADGGAKRAVEYARKHIGVHENPPDSNGGGLIDTWEQFWGLGHVFWCGCFAGYCVKHEGGAKVDTWIPYSGSIDADARAGVRGLHAVPPSEARAGDLVTFEFEGGPPSDHVGLIVGPSENGMVHTIEGNTSPSDGSQSNGGCVAEKRRPFSEVVTVARPNY